jgi:hypothetical protein
MPQQARPLLIMSVTAVGAITQYRGVGYNGAQATVAGQKTLGFARRNGATGTDVDLVSKGTATAEVGAAVAVGAALAVDSVGRVVTATAVQIAAGATAVTSAAANGAGTISGGDLPQFVVGYALTAAAAAGETIEILLS